MSFNSKSGSLPIGSYLFGAKDESKGLQDIKSEYTEPSAKSPHSRWNIHQLLGARITQVMKERNPPRSATSPEKKEGSEWPSASAEEKEPGPIGGARRSSLLGLDIQNNPIKARHLNLKKDKAVIDETKMILQKLGESLKADFQGTRKYVSQTPAKPEQKSPNELDFSAGKAFGSSQVKQKPAGWGSTFRKISGTSVPVEQAAGNQ
jgi:hypothetical protein